MEAQKATEAAREKEELRAASKCMTIFVLLFLILKKND
jgi:hypothetical protein